MARNYLDLSQRQLRGMRHTIITTRGKSSGLRHAGPSFTAVVLVGPGPVVGNCQLVLAAGLGPAMVLCTAQGVPLKQNIWR